MSRLILKKILIELDWKTEKYFEWLPPIAGITNARGLVLADDTLDCCSLGEGLIDSQLAAHHSACVYFQECYKNTSTW